MCECRSKDIELTDKLTADGYKIIRCCTCGEESVSFLDILEKNPLNHTLREQYSFKLRGVKE